MFSANVRTRATLIGAGNGVVNKGVHRRFIYGPGVDYSGSFGGHDGGSNCDLPADGGRCRAYKMRFAYSRTSGECKMFVFGGCGGNSNNFHTIESCRETCMDMETRGGTPFSDNNGIDKYDDFIGYETDGEYWIDNNEINNNNIEYGTGGGTPVIDNNGIKVARAGILSFQCRNKFVVGAGGSGASCRSYNFNCNLPIKVGMCGRARLLSYAYSTTTGKCESFYYSGCGGSSNNFHKIESCRETCMKKKETREKRPFIDNNGIDRAGAGISSSQCRNRFAVGSGGSASSCRSYNSNCNPPMELGMCRARIPRYAYSRTRGNCEMFYYGGCGGNSNNFKTRVACRATCMEWPKCNHKFSGNGPCPWDSWVR
jgi:hypothetical protein